MKFNYICVDKGDTCVYATVNGTCSVTACTMEPRLKTNADHIREMSDEELGLFLGEWAEKHLCWMCDGTGEVLAWLQSQRRI